MAKDSKNEKYSSPRAVAIKYAARGPVMLDLDDLVSDQFIAVDAEVAAFTAQTKV